MGNKTHKQDNMVLPVLTVQEVFISLNEYLEYLLDMYRTQYTVCMNKREQLDKAVLETKITLLTERVFRVKKQLDKHNK